MTINLKINKKINLKSHTIKIKNFTDEVVYLKFKKLKLHFIRNRGNKNKF